MEAKISKHSFSLFNLKIQQSLLWVRKLKSSFSLWPLLQLWEPSFTVSKDHVRQGIQIFLVACRELATNPRHLVGSGLVMVGLFSGVAYHFFNPLSIDKEWYFLNWYYFLYTIREELLLGFWAIGTFLLLPAKYMLAFIPCTLALTYAIASILHYSFFAVSLETFHEPVEYSILVSAGACAIGLIISSDYLAYRKYHLKDGTAGRILGIWKAPNVPDQKRAEIMDVLAEESENFNARV